MKLEYIVKKEDVGKIVKEILITKLKISHRLLIKLKKGNCIFLNNIPTYIDKPLNYLDKITVNLNYNEDNTNIISKQMQLDILYEDDCYLVVNKPFGIPVHPSILHYEDSLSSGVKFYYDSIKLNKKIRPVIRIDKNTSGIVIFAKNEYVQENLILQMKNNSFHKEYVAIVEGYFNNIKGTINAPISRKDNSIIERCINSSGDMAITDYEVIKELEIYGRKISVLKCILKTGRTHQIRVHMSYIGHPLLGDDLYGGSLDLINRQALHCYRLSFNHPITNINVTYEAPIPEDMKNLIN